MRWPVVGLALTACCLLAAVLPPELMAYSQEAIGHSQWWRLWTGHMVRFGAAHLLFDILPLLAFCALLEDWLGRRTLALMLLLGMPSVSMALWLTLPEMGTYRGASAMVSMLWTCAGLLGLYDRNHGPGFRAASGALFIVFVVKLVADAHGLLIGVSILPPDVRVAWQAHAWAGGAGLLTAILSIRRTRIMV